MHQRLHHRSWVHHRLHQRSQIRHIGSWIHLRLHHRPCSKRKEQHKEAADVRLKHAQRNKRMDEGTAVKVVRREGKPMHGPVGGITSR